MIRILNKMIHHKKIEFHRLVTDCFDLNSDNLFNSSLAETDCLKKVTKVLILFIKFLTYSTLSKAF